MKSLYKLIKAFELFIKEPWLINHFFKDNIIWEKKCLKDFGSSCRLAQLPLNFIVKDDPFIIDYLFVEGGSMPTDLALLQSLAKRIENCKYLEIGTSRGESTLNVSQHVKKCITIDLPREDKEKMKMSKSVIDQSGMLIQGKNNVEQILVDTKEFNFSSLNDKFDLIFIDGDHSWKGIVNDTKKVMKSAIHPKSIIVWHDYGNSPETIRYEVLHAILSSVPKEHHHRIYHIKNTKSAVLFPETITNATPFKEFQKPESIFNLKISLEQLNS